MVSARILQQHSYRRKQEGKGRTQNEALVTRDTGVNLGFLNLPLTDIREDLVADGGLFGSSRDSPSRVRDRLDELLDEGRGKRGGLKSHKGSELGLFQSRSDTGKTYVEDSLVCKSASGHDEGAGTSYSSDVLGTHFDDLSMRCGLKIRVVECGGKGGWDEWKTRLTPQRQPSTWKIPG